MQKNLAKATYPDGLISFQELGFLVLGYCSVWDSKFFGLAFLSFLRIAYTFRLYVIH